VVNHLKAITMAQHRSDKAKILSFIRQARNAERRAVKEILANQERGRHTELLNQIRDNMSLLEDVAKQSIAFTGTGLASSLFHLRFHTADVSAVDMARVHRVWLSLYLNSTSPDTMLMHVISGAQLRSLKTEPTAYLDACALVVATARRLASDISRQLQMWDEVVEQLKALLCASEHAVKAPLVAYRGIIQSSPYAQTGFDNFSWNPNAENFRRILTDKLSMVTASLSQLEQGRVALLKLTQTGRRTGAQKLSFAGKLSVISGRAA